MSFKEQEFRTTAEYLNYVLPRQFDDWRKFFLNETRFLEAANAWLNAKFKGVAHPRIEDDVDRGLMKRASMAYTPSHRTDIELDEPKSVYDDEEYWNAYMGYEEFPRTPSKHNYTNFKNWSWQGGLPVTDLKIPAPNGMSHIDMATVF